MYKFFKFAAAALLAIAVFIAAPLAFPSPLFAYGVQYKNLSVYSDRPLPEKQATAFLKDVQTGLQKLPQLLDGKPMQIYVTSNNWRQKWLWIIVPKNVAGFVATPVSRRHVFLSGADFKTGELINRSGYRPPPPRTLAYYGMHELTHVTMSQKLGWIRFNLMPNWIREGMADYVAMPPQTARSLYRQIGFKRADKQMMQTLGVYAPYRLLVTHFIEDKHWSLEKLFSSNLSYKQAQKIAAKAFEK